MPLENTSANYFYCATQGLPPLPPRKKKMQTPTTTLYSTHYRRHSVVPTTHAPTPTVIVVQRRVHWPDDLDTHQVVEFNKVDAKFANNIGSPFEGE